jgi:ABC-2 type transport system permease protein
MSKTIRIALRDYCEAVRTKAFLIGIVLAPLLMSGGILSMVLLEDHVDTSDKRIAVVDFSGQIYQSLREAADRRNRNEILDPETGLKAAPAYLLEEVKPDRENPEAQQLELSSRVRNKQLLAFLVIGADVLHPGEPAENAKDSPAKKITYHAEGAIFHEARQWLTKPINDRIQSLRLAESGLDEAKVKAAIRWVNVETLGLASVDRSTGKVHEAQEDNPAVAMGVPIFMVMLMFMMIMMGATPLLHSVLEEKTQRISEVLLGSVRPFQLMMGKLLGNLGVSFTAATVYILAGLGACYYMDMAQDIPYHILPWFFTYMIAAVFMSGAMFIAVGSACNDAKELQSLTMPVMLPMMIPMFVLGPVLKEPASSFAVGLSLVPPCTPMLMLLRQSMPGGVPLWQPLAGLIGVALYTLFCVWAGGRIFRIALLTQGSTPKISDLCRWALRG